jgi:hypothetical protein
LTEQAWDRWQAAAGPWKGWSVCPALLAAEPVARRRIAYKPRVRADELASGLRGTLAKGGVLVLLDLEPVIGVHLAARLNEWRLANAVLVLPRWPYQTAVLPVDELVDALVSQARQLTTDEQLPNVVFVLDAERSQPIVRRSQRDPRADNRYRLSVADLPDLASLRKRGIRQVVKLARENRRPDN